MSVLHWFYYQISFPGSDYNTAQVPVWNHNSGSKCCFQYNKSWNRSQKKSIRCAKEASVRGALPSVLRCKIWHASLWSRLLCYSHHLSANEVNDFVKPTKEIHQKIAPGLQKMRLSAQRLLQNPLQDWVRISLLVCKVEMLLSSQYSFYLHEHGSCLLWYSIMVSPTESFVNISIPSNPNALLHPMSQRRLMRKSSMAWRFSGMHLQDGGYAPLPAFLYGKIWRRKIQQLEVPGILVSAMFLAILQSRWASGTSKSIELHQANS